MTKLMKKTLLTIAALAAFGSMTVGAMPHASALIAGTKACNNPEPIPDTGVWVDTDEEGEANSIVETCLPD